jgi:phosphatidylinositol alpha-1,6-mannosyltransferase
MKILFITIDFPPDVGGVANYYRNVCHYLSGVDLTLLTEKRGNNDSFDQEKKYKIIRKDLFYKSIWPKWLKMLFVVYKSVKNEKPDWIFVGQVLPVGTVVYLLQKIFKFKYLVFTHGTDINVPLNYPRKRKIMIRILKKADNIAANSHYTMKRLAHLGVNEDKVVVLFPCPLVKNQESTLLRTDLRQGFGGQGSKKQELIKQYGLENKFVLLTIGRIVERKGIDNVIEALSEVKKEFNDFVYLVVGKGPDKSRLADLISKYNLSENVKLVGYVSDKELQLFYQACDIYIMTPREIEGDVEGFGMVYLEANFHGKPVIASRTGGVIEAVLDNQTGLLSDQGNIEQIKDAILRLIKDKDLRERLGENGRKRVADKFQWQEQVGKLNDIL